MKKEYFRTTNGLQLLRDWSSGCEYQKNTERARSAAAALFLKGFKGA